MTFLSKLDALIAGCAEGTFYHKELTALREDANQFISDLKDVIAAHSFCKEYHTIDGEPATCLDIVFQWLQVKHKKP